MRSKTPWLLSLALIAGVANAADAPPLQPGSPIRISAEGKRFDLLTVDAAQYRLLAAHSQAGTLSVVDTADGKYFVVTLTGVTFIDSKTLDKSAFVATPGPTDAMVYADGKLYVGHDDGSELWVIDVKSAKLTGSIAIPGVPEIADADGKHLYQNIKDKNEVAVIDLGTGKVTATWATPSTDSPHGLALDAKAGRLYISGHSANVSVLSVADGKAGALINIGDGRSDQTAFDAGNGRLYIPSSGRLVTVQASDGKVLGEVAIPQGCHSVAVDPTTHRVWIAYADDKASYVQAFTPSH